MRKKWENMQFRLSNSQRYLVNTILTLTIVLTLLTLMVTISGNRKPINLTNPTTKYRCEFDNLNCIICERVDGLEIIKSTSANTL